MKMKFVSPPNYTFNAPKEKYNQLGKLRQIYVGILANIVTFFLMINEEHDFLYQLLQNFRKKSLSRCIYHFFSFPMCFNHIF
jgi:hypothetical protein